MIYGGTSAGIAAAIQASRSGKTVVLIEPTRRIGGLTTGGLGATDIGNKQAIGGISREFYQNIRKYYDDPAHWKWQDRSEYRGGRNNENEDAMWTFEPSAALQVYMDMIAKEKITVLYGERLDRNNGVKKKGNNITSIVMESGAAFQGRMFIDATYEGDLMAAAGVSYDRRMKPSDCILFSGGAHDTTDPGDRLVISGSALADEVTLNNAALTTGAGSISVEDVETVIIGKRDSLQLLVVALLCEGHVLLEDVPGMR